MTARSTAKRDRPRRAAKFLCHCGGGITLLRGHFGRLGDDMAIGCVRAPLSSWYDAKVRLFYLPACAAPPAALRVSCYEDCVRHHCRPCWGLLIIVVVFIIINITQSPFAAANYSSSHAACSSCIRLDGASLSSTNGSCWLLLLACFGRL